MKPFCASNSHSLVSSCYQEQTTKLHEYYAYKLHWRMPFDSVVQKDADK